MGLVRRQLVLQDVQVSEAAQLYDYRDFVASLIAVRPMEPLPVFLNYSGNGINYANNAFETQRIRVEVDNRWLT